MGTIFSFICTSITPSVAIDTVQNPMMPISNGKKLYVGGTGEGNYSKIQDAIDDAISGDTVFVYSYSSPYYENVDVDKSISLIGEDRDTTIVEGEETGSGVTISDDWVNISGFTFQNCGHSLYEAGVCIATCHNTVSGNNIINNGFGVSFLDGSNTLSDNNITNNNYGILIFEGNNNNIINNIITNNTEYGIGPYGSSSNTYSSNTITYNHHGIMFYDFSNDNIISSNTISYNTDSGIYLSYQDSHTIIGNNITYNGYCGIYLEGSCYNDIYHNNFINNYQNAFAECDNIWEDGYLAGGNYWDDYNGTDSDGDGIGDTPYTIPGGNNKDRYPLMEPWEGNLPPVANFSYYYNTAQIIFDGSFSYDRDGEIISYEWDFGEGTTGTGEIIVHKFCEIGTYNVTLTVTDDDGLKDNITKSAEIILANIPPSKPEIYGPNTGKPGMELEYVFNVTDPDGDDAYLWVDWGNGDSTGWIGALGSDDSVKLNHTWNESGTYVIMAKVKDECVESEWATLEITIPRNKASIDSLFQWFFERFPLLEVIILRAMNLLR